VAGGGNYAYGGARTDYVSPGLPPTALSFNQQLDAYYGSHVTADPNALYVLWIGANDMADAIKAAALGNTTAITTAVTTAVGGIGNAIGGLASLGAQHFLVPNLPDLSLTPAIRAFGSAGLTALAHGASAGFNTNLATTLDLGVFAALDIRTLDAFAAQTEITANPVAYGFSNVTQACYTGEVDGSALPHGPTPSVCADPAAYLYWDYEHPTAALHAELAGRAYAAAVPEPAVWLLLIAGAGFGALVRRARAA
jgi:phospholipase/lecithinase/hemolysin